MASDKQLQIANDFTSIALQKGYDKNKYKAGLYKLNLQPSEVNAYVESNFTDSSNVYGEINGIEITDANVDKMEKFFELQNRYGGGTGEVDPLAGLSPDKQFEVREERKLKEDDRLSTVDLLTGDIEKVKLLQDDITNNRGFKAAVGAGFGKSVRSILPFGGGATDFVSGTEAADFNAKRTQIVSTLIVNAREKLAGQGTITDAEQKALADAETILADPKISEEAFIAEVQRVKDALESGLAKVQGLSGSVQDSSTGDEPITDRKLQLALTNPNNPKARAYIESQGYDPETGKKKVDNAESGFNIGLSETQSQGLGENTPENGAIVGGLPIPGFGQDFSRTEGEDTLFSRVSEAYTKRRGSIAESFQRLDSGEQLRGDTGTQVTGDVLGFIFDLGEAAVAETADLATSDKEFAELGEEIKKNPAVAAGLQAASRGIETYSTWKNSSTDNKVNAENFEALANIGGGIISVLTGGAARTAFKAATQTIQEGVDSGIRSATKNADEVVTLPKTGDEIVDVITDKRETGSSDSSLGFNDRENNSRFSDVKPNSTLLNTDSAKDQIEREIEELVLEGIEKDKPGAVGRITAGMNLLTESRAADGIRQRILGDPKIDRSIKERIKNKPDAYNFYVSAAINRNNSDTMRAAPQVAADKYIATVDMAQDILNDIGSEIGKFRKEYGGTTVDKNKLASVINGLNSKLESQGVRVSKDQDGKIKVEDIDGRRGVYSDSERKMIGEFFDDIEFATTTGTLESLVDVISRVGSKADFGKSSQEVSGNIDGIAKSIRADLAKVNRESIPKDQAKLLDDYSNAADEIAILNKSRNNPNFLMNRLYSDRNGQALTNAESLKNLTGYDIQDDATFAWLATKMFGNDSQKSLFEQGIKNSTMDAAFSMGIGDPTGGLLGKVVSSLANKVLNSDLRYEKAIEKLVFGKDSERKSRIKGAFGQLKNAATSKTTKGSADFVQFGKDAKGGFDSLVTKSAGVTQKKVKQFAEELSSDDIQSIRRYLTGDNKDANQSFKDFNKVEEIITKFNIKKNPSDKEKRDVLEQIVDGREGLIRNDLEKSKAGSDTDIK